MGVFGKREDPGDEQQPGGSSPWVDLGLRACPVCRRELMSWEERCPDDGAPGVRRSELPSDSQLPIPQHLRDEPALPDQPAPPDQPASPDAP